MNIRLDSHLRPQPTHETAFAKKICFVLLWLMQLLIRNRQQYIRFNLGINDAIPDLIFVLNACNECIEWMKKNFGQSK